MLTVFVKWPLRLIVWLLALTGLAGLILVALVASPMPDPGVNRAVVEAATGIDRSDLPIVRPFQARDGTELAYRLYPPGEGDPDTIVVAVHGSAGSSATLNALSNALAAAGIPVVAPDIRGHGRSGQRGDIGYIGQLEDDLEDLIAGLRDVFPHARLVLLGHSLGGGFALRIAASPLGDAFERFVLLAPYLGPFAPTTRTPDDDGGDAWAYPDVPRIVALDLLHANGIDCCGGLPVIAFALPPDQRRHATLRYSFRLLKNFGPPEDYAAAFADAAAPVTVLAGTDDSLIAADAFADIVDGVDPPVTVDILPQVDHMGIITDPAALDRVVAAVRGGTAVGGG